MKNIEDYRNNDYGSAAFALSVTPPTKVYVHYNNFCISAYKQSVSNLSELEHSTDFLNNGTQILPAISMWFLAVDSFFNSLLKITCLKVGINYLGVMVIPLSAKYQLLVQHLSVEADSTLQLILYKKIKDLETFNAYTPHDVFEEEKPKYLVAQFSTSSMLVNQADNILALIIAYEVFEAFRFVITGLDLMPSISLMTKEKKLVFEKFGVLVHKVILPAFKDILMKHKLTTKIDLSGNSFNFPVSALFTTKQILMIEKIQEDKQYKVELSKSPTNILGEFHAMMMKKFEGSNGKFGSANFYTVNPLI